MKEPKLRKDGRCLTCKGERVVRPRAGIAPALYELDPFCSAECARKWWGTDFGSGYVVGRPKKQGA